MQVKNLVILLTFAVGSALAQTTTTTYDNKTLVDTNSTSTSTSTVNSNNTSTSTSTNTSTSTVNSTNTNNNNNTSTSTSTNTNINQNINSGTQTINNNNVNSGTMTYNNNNVNTGTMTNNNNNVNTSTSTNTNTNNNINTGDMTNRNINDSNITQKVIQPPPTAIAPAMMSGGNNDLCTTGTSGAVQTQILGISSGGTIRDMNCERLKNAKTLYDMGMKVAAVSIMCQDRRVFDAMWNAGTPCPYEGVIGEQARVAWNENTNKWPKYEEPKSDDFYKKTGWGALLGILLFSLF
jgi:hypothetical protein